MLLRLRRILFSVPAIAAVVLFTLYLLGGYFALPAVIKWQIEKQVPARLGHRISIGEVRFDPLTLRLELDNLALSDPAGRAMLGFERFRADFELRSVVDGAWTFAEATLEAPVLQLDLEEDGRHNFSALLDRLSEEQPEQQAEQESGALPRFVVGRVALTEGRIAFTDRQLAEPVVVHVEPLQIGIAGLSSLPAQRGSYRLSARTAAGETLEASGNIALDPVAASGRLTLNGVKVSTLARSVSRLVALDAPSGSIDFAADFDLALDRSGAISGVAQAVDLDVAALSVNAAGAKVPLVAFESLSLRQGRVDLGKHEARLASFRLAKGSLSASIDEQGRIDWTRLARSFAASSANEAVSAAPAAPAESTAAASAAPWRISVASVEVADVALLLSDRSRGRSATVAAVSFELAPTAEIAGANARVEIGKPKLSARGVRVVSGADSLAAPAAVVEAERLAIVVAGGRFEAALDALHVASTDRLSARSGKATLELGSIRAQVDSVALRGADAALTATLDGPKITLAGASISGADEGAQLGDLTFEGQRLAVQQAPGQFQVRLDRARSAFGDLRMRRGADGVDLRGGTILSETLSIARADAGSRVITGTPMLSMSPLAANRGDEMAKLGERSIDSGSVALASAGDGKPDLGLKQVRTTGNHRAMSRGGEGDDRRKAVLGGESIAPTQGDGRLRVVGSGARASVSGVQARRGSDRIAVRDASFEARAMNASAGGTSPQASAVKARLEDAALRLTSVGVIARGAASDIAQVAAARLGARSLQLALTEGPADLAVEGLTATLSDAVVRSPADASEMLRLGSVALAGGTVRLPDRVIHADKIALADGTAKAWLDASGRFNWTTDFGVASDRASETTEARASAAQESAPAWRLALGAAELDRLAVGFEDRRESPPFTVGLEGIRSRATGLDTGSSTPMQLEFRAQVASGGEVRASGDVRADNGTADLQVSADGVALAPIQPYLAGVAGLRLASGAVSAEGRLRYGGAADAMLAYKGSVAVSRLVLEEVEAKRPFLTWDSVATDDFALTLQPNQVDVGELRIDRPSARLIIAEDQSLNLMDVLKRPKEGEDASGASGRARGSSKAEPEEQREAVDSPFPVTVARVRVADGTLDFADLSLRPQFRARMHGLKGVISGVSTDESQSATLQFDARVDKYGSAKIRGQISVRRPERATGLDLVFRNLEMTSLSPYVVKFAGYRIAAGRLALDLQYEVKQSKLVGKNKIVLHQIELGEKVDSPGAQDLPLELAIAILKDSKGVIDIGLPVSGDLSNPSFDYGEVIGQALGSLLGGIVTAPFRALGALLGGTNGKRLGRLEFEPGSDAIAPPEQQKLETVARALMERPSLRLVVPATYATKQDTPALKSLAVRAEIVGRMNVRMAAGEDPGPIEVANPRTQRAVEAAFSQRYAPEVLDVLKRRAVEAAARAGEATDRVGQPKQETRPDRGSSAAGSASPPPAFYQTLVDRMIAEEPVSDEKLRQLATRRGEAIVRELTTTGGLPAARVMLAEPRQASEADEQAVVLQLELEVAD